jgi:hypothetical protein
VVAPDGAILYGERLTGEIRRIDPSTGKDTHVFGLASDTRTDDLWETENGPECNDEINRIRRGFNYGWGPAETCHGRAPRNTNQDGTAPTLPLTFYPVTQGPHGHRFLRRVRSRLGPGGRRVRGSFNTGDIHEITLNENRTEIVHDTTPFNHGTFVLSLERGPVGTI